MLVDEPQGLHDCLEALAAPVPAPVPLDSIDFAPAATAAGGASLDSLLHPIVTPFRADVWHDDLLAAGLLDRFSHVPVGMLQGFDVGLPRTTIDAYFARTKEPFKLYDNHKTAEKFPEVIDKMIAEETKEGRISAFYKPAELQKLVGTFRNAPLTIAAKNGNFAEGRVCQDFSHPRDDPMDISFNASVDRSRFSCDWGTFAQCYLLAAAAPTTAQVAVFDVKAAHRRIPILPWQQCYNVIYWRNTCALDFCTQFGSAPASDLWGGVADAFRGLFHYRFPTSRALNWADDFTFWRYLNANGGFDVDESDIYAMAGRLGWPWSEKKTKPFSHEFPYLGFTWNLRDKTVRMTDKKKDKYLSAMENWREGSAVRKKEAQQLLGKLVHVALVLPEGRSRLPELSKFTAAFKGANPFIQHKLPALVLEDIAWWRDALSREFCGMNIVSVPDPDKVEVYVDASTSFGIGIVIDGTWDHWRLKTGWKDNGRDIGWAEMVAVELGLRALVERGFRDVHIKLWSDNEGVVGALDAGKSRNTQSNRVLQRLVSWMVANSIWLSVEWVPSANNKADAPSRGQAPAGMTRKKHKFRVPFQLREFVEEMK